MVRSILTASALSLAIASNLLTGGVAIAVYSDRAKDSAPVVEEVKQEASESDAAPHRASGRRNKAQNEPWTPPVEDGPEGGTRDAGTRQSVSDECFEEGARRLGGGACTND